MKWHGWANDRFQNGGHLVDNHTWYAARDKVQHVVAFGLLWFILALTPWEFGLRLTIWESVAIGWELFEWWRYDLWVRGGFAAVMPSFADRPSWRDLIANHAGGLLAALYLAALL